MSATIIDRAEIAVCSDVVLMAEVLMTLTSDRAFEWQDARFNARQICWDARQSGYTQDAAECDYRFLTVALEAVTEEINQEEAEPPAGEGWRDAALMGALITERENPLDEQRRMCL